MSTTFGIKTSRGPVTENNIVEVAFRGNGTGVIWTNKLGKLLPDDTPVIPLDNSPQGILTIGDLKREIDGYDIDEIEDQLDLGDFIIYKPVNWDKQHVEMRYYGFDFEPAKISISELKELKDFITKIIDEAD